MFYVAKILPLNKSCSISNMLSPVLTGPGFSLFCLMKLLLLILQCFQEQQSMLILPLKLSLATNNNWQEQLTFCQSFFYFLKKTTKSLLRRRASSDGRAGTSYSVFLTDPSSNPGLGPLENSMLSLTSIDGHVIQDKQSLLMGIQTLYV